MAMRAGLLADSKNELPGGYVESLGQYRRKLLYYSQINQYFQMSDKPCKHSGR